MMTPSEMQSTFSPAELRVLRELAKGSTNKEIARAIGCADGTVKVHMKAIQKKTGVSNRTKIVLRLFYLTYEEDRAAAAMAAEFSGKLTLVTWNDPDHSVTTEVRDDKDTAVPVGSAVLQRRPNAAVSV